MLGKVLPNDKEKGDAKMARKVERIPGPEGYGHSVARDVLERFVRSGDRFWELEDADVAAYKTPDAAYRMMIKDRAVPVRFVRRRGRLYLERLGEEKTAPSSDA